MRLRKNDELQNSSASLIERILSNRKLSVRNLLIKVQRSFLESFSSIGLMIKKLFFKLQAAILTLPIHVLPRLRKCRHFIEHITGGASRTVFRAWSDEFYVWNTRGGTFASTWPLDDGDACAFREWAGITHSRPLIRVGTRLPTAYEACIHHRYPACPPFSTFEIRFAANFKFHLSW